VTRGPSLNQIQNHPENQSKDQIQNRIQNHLRRDPVTLNTPHTGPECTTMETPLKIAIEHQNQPETELESRLIEAVDGLIKAVSDVCDERDVDTAELETVVERYSATGDCTETFAVLAKMVKALGL